MTMLLFQPLLPVQLLLGLLLVHAQGLYADRYCTSSADVALKQEGECIDQLPRCPIWAHQHNYCVLNPGFMEEYCPSSCRFCHRINLGTLTPSAGKEEDDDRESKSKQVLDRLLETAAEHKRRRNLRLGESQLAARTSSCEQMLATCTSVKNRKSTSTAFMTQYCTAACESCRTQHHFNLTCPLEEPATYQVGDVGRILENITATTVDEHETVELISKDPWLIVIDDFLSDAECDALVLCGTNAGLTQTADVSTRGRQSSYHRSRRASIALCETEDGIISDLYSRIEELVQVPHANTEPIQIVKYNPGQFHKLHHDYDDYPGRRSNRVLTVLLYLNTVQQGGGTYFPEVENTTIGARKGRAVIWSNAYDSSSSLWQKDKRLIHEDLPVVKGLKYVANFWIHPRQFRSGKTWEDEEMEGSQNQDPDYAFA
jgi:prolyl 4-hydroxylase